MVSRKNIGSRRVLLRVPPAWELLCFMAALPILSGGITKVTVKTFCSPGKAEFVKGGVHFAASAIVGVMAVYNGVAWCFRRERHLRWNTVFYTAALAFEIHQTRRHLKREEHRSLSPLRG